MLGWNRSGSLWKGGTNEAHGKGKELRGMELLEEGTSVNQSSSPQDIGVNHDKEALLFYDSQAALHIRRS